MDPTSLIVAALSAGAVSGLKDTATAIVKDSYTELKALIANKYPAVVVSQLEAAPESPQRREVMLQEIQRVGAQNDAELVQKAQSLLAIIDDCDNAAAQTLGVVLTGAHAEALDVRNVAATGAGAVGVQADTVVIEGAITVSGIHAEANAPKKTDK